MVYLPENILKIKRKPLLIQIGIVIATMSFIIELKIFFDFPQFVNVIQLILITASCVIIGSVVEIRKEKRRVA